MNIINKALDTVMRSIPREVLEVAFNEGTQNWRRAPISLDDRIVSQVIRSRVIVDTNIVGGQTIIVSLEGVAARYSDTYSLVYEIPAELLMYRTLMSVLSVGYMPYNNSFNMTGNGINSINAGSMGDVTAAAQRVGSSMSSVPVVSTATADIVGYNTVVIRDSMRITGAYQLRCVVANEENLNNINPRSHLNFAQLCLYAIKSHIYNTMIIKIDQAYLTGGQELGRFKEVVDSYSDAEEMYLTYLRDVWRAVSFMNDSQSHDRMIRLMINPGL